MSDLRILCVPTLPSARSDVGRFGEFGECRTIIKKAAKSNTLPNYPKNLCQNMPTEIDFSSNL